MPAEHLQILQPQKLAEATMLLALTGWMDGGLVSTGTVRRMMDNRDVLEIARIESDPLSLYSFPGSLGVAAPCRPEVKMKGGLLRGELHLPTNISHCDPAANLVFFLGKE